MRTTIVFAAASLALALPSLSFAAGYAVRGTYVDYGTVSAPTEARRVPAVLYVSIRAREARLRLEAPGARCVPELGSSTYSGGARGIPGALAIHVRQKSECLHGSESARLQLQSVRGGLRAVLTDRNRDGVVLFEAN